MESILQINFFRSDTSFFTNEKQDEISNGAVWRYTDLFMELQGVFYRQLILV